MSDIADYNEALTIMQNLADNHECVGVFVDYGWHEPNGMFDIIVNGKGQDPIASISEDVYKLLYKNKKIHGNSLQTYKKRKYHEFNRGEFSEYYGMEFYRDLKQ